ncbi:MAG: hypothetical protein R2875_16940 [Desulfobacterales bacterium]
MHALLDVAGPSVQTLSGLSSDQAAAEIMGLRKMHRASEKQALERQLKRNERLKNLPKQKEHRRCRARTLCEEAGCSRYQDPVMRENRSGQVRREIESNPYR